MLLGVEKRFELESIEWFSPVFDIDQSGAILGKVWSGRDVLRPTQGVVGSEPDLPTVGLDGLQTSADVCQAASKKLLFRTSRRRLLLYGLCIACIV
jgi:hypothetical protein